MTIASLCCSLDRSGIVEAQLRTSITDADLQVRGRLMGRHRQWATLAGKEQLL
jgi:hypothetical protein